MSVLANCVKPDGTTFALDSAFNLHIYWSRADQRKVHKPRTVALLLASACHQIKPWWLTRSIRERLSDARPS